MNIDLELGDVLYIKLPNGKKYDVYYDEKTGLLAWNEVQE